MTPRPDQSSKKSDDYMPWRDETVLDIIGDNDYHDKLEADHPKDVNPNTSHLTSQNEMVSTDPQAQGGGYDGLDADIDKMLMWNIQGHTEPVVFQPEMKAAIKKLITSRLRALVTGMEAERPENLTGPIKLGTYLESKIDQIESDAAMVIAYRKGFNTANAQWGTLLAKKRDTL